MISDAICSCCSCTSPKDVGELQLWRYAQVLECLPVAWRGAAEEELDAAVGDRKRAASKPPLILEVGEVIADLRFAQGVGRLMEVYSELTEART